MGDIHDTAPTTDPATGRSSLLGSGRVRVGAVIAIAIAGGLIAWLLTRGGGGHSTAPQLSSGEVLPGIPAGTHVGPIPLAASGLSNTAAALHQPVYWLGTKSGYTYQIERTADNNVYLSYLPAGVGATNDRSKYVVVGSYPFKNPLQALRKVGEQAGNAIIDLRSGGIVVPGKQHPLSVWVAYPSVDTEVEIYSPHPGEARQLALSGKLRPVS